jgi:outer membrane protein OmpA-like peptidoglycan-associated protein
VASTNRNVKWRVEVRREFVEDVGNWSFTAGLGTWPIVRATRAAAIPRAAPAAPVTEQFAPVLDDEEAADPRGGGDGAGGTSAEEVERLARVLREENRNMRDEVVTLRQELEAERSRAATTPPPAAPGPAALPSGWTIPALFAFTLDGAGLTDAGREEVRRIADELLVHADVRVSVEGHTDSAGDALRNLTLSEQRAMAVRAELIRLGVEPSRVRASGLGSTMPLSDEDTEDGHRRNQRVEVRVLTR